MPITKNQDGKNAKHRNHTVPRCLLKRWLGSIGGETGHWVLDCSADTATITGQAGENAAFAIREFIYVPVREVDEDSAFRDEWLENWFSQGENDLSAVTDKILAGRISDIKGKEFGGFVQAAILLGFRSAYEYERVEEELEQRRPDMPVEQRARLVIDGFKQLYSEKLHQFKNWDYRIFTNLSEPLLICDRPLFDMTVTATREEGISIPLAPDLLLVATPPQDPARDMLSFQLINTEKGGTLAKKTNHMTMERARQFVVGQHAQLTKLLPQFASNEFQKRKATDTFRGFVKVPLS